MENKLSARIANVRKILRALYPEVKPQLHFRNPFELLLATMMSSQCTKWRDFSLRLIFLGRETCPARRPKCSVRLFDPLYL